MHVTFANGTDGQQQLVRAAMAFSTYDFDQVDSEVEFVFVDTVPENHTDVGYTTVYSNGSARVELVNNLAQQAGGDRFAFETVIHELGHVINFLMSTDQDRRLCSYFGAPWSAWASGESTHMDWRNTVKESVAETFKDIFLPGELRAFDNRTARKLPRGHFLDFVNEFCTPPSFAPIAGKLGHVPGWNNPAIHDFGTAVSGDTYEIVVRFDVAFVQAGILQVSGLLVSRTPFAVHFETPGGSYPIVPQLYGDAHGWWGDFHAECPVAAGGEYTMHLVAPPPGGSFFEGQAALVSTLSEIGAVYSWGGAAVGQTWVPDWPYPQPGDIALELQASALREIRAALTPRSRLNLDTAIAQARRRLALAAGAKTAVVGAELAMRAQVAAESAIRPPPDSGGGPPIS